MACQTLSARRVVYTHPIRAEHSRTVSCIGILYRYLAMYGGMRSISILLNTHTILLRTVVLKTRSPFHPAAVLHCQLCCYAVLLCWYAAAVRLYVTAAGVPRHGRSREEVCIRHRQDDHVAGRKQWVVVVVASSG